MLLVPLVLVGLLDLVQREHLVVDHRLDVIGLDGPVHLLELLPATHINTSDGADVGQGLEDRGLFLPLDPAQESNDADDPIEPDRLERLVHGVRPADFDDMLDPTRSCDLLGGLSPVLIFGVEDDVVGADRLDSVSLGLGRRGRDDSSPNGLCELVEGSVVSPVSGLDRLILSYRSGTLTWIANMETPPVPWVKTQSPGSKGLSPNKAFQAVNPAQVKVAPSTKSRLLGKATRPSSLKAPYCCSEPSITPPVPVVMM